MRLLNVLEKNKHTQNTALLFILTNFKYYPMTLLLPYINYVGLTCTKKIQITSIRNERESVTIDAKNIKKEVKNIMNNSMFSSLII